MMDFYQQRILRLSTHIAELEARDSRLSRMRGFVFLASLVLALAWATGLGTWSLVVSGLVFVGFVVTVGYHEQIQRQLKKESLRREIAQHQQARIRRDWASLPAEAQRPSPPAQELIDQAPTWLLDDTVVADLNVLGIGSIWMLLNQATTPLGQQQLHAWLRSPAERSEIESRQAAVQALAQRPEFCLDLYLSGRMLTDVRGDSVNFLRWAEGESWLSQRPDLIWLTRLLAAGLFALFVALVLQWLPPAAWLLFVAWFIGHVVVNMLWVGRVHDLFNRISSGKYDLLHFTEMFEATAHLPDDAPRLTQLRNQMRAGDAQFEDAFGQLQRILQLANGRKSGLMGIPWLFLQLLVFWDFHVLLWLERWQRQFGRNVRHWFEAVGELEALASLATLAHDHPDWSFPAVDDEHLKLTATAMGHPLISPEECVVNDVELGPPGTFLLVTGSNMSGKSTLLRAIGANVVLGLAGGPTCTADFRLPTVELATSMRIQDSLNEGVSLFMAELKRIKLIVDRARDLNTSSQPRMLYLLDEILQGTNSAERHIAVTRIVRHLLATRALGAISTHDLELADDEQLKAVCQLVHLRETIERFDDREHMTFDYVLRQGVTPTTNALRLLEMVGLGSPELGSPS